MPIRIKRTETVVFLRDFENYKTQELEFLEYEIENDSGDEKEYDEFKEHFTFDSWATAVKKFALILADDIFDSDTCDYKELEEERKKPLNLTEKRVIDTLPFSWDSRFYGLDVEETGLWSVFRVILDAFSPDETIELDYTNLYDGGWCDEFPSKDDFGVEKTIILTEGKFDAEVIKASIDLLYPYMSKFYSFINFSEYRVQGSTNFLTHYLRAFIASGINNRVIAIYDNDSAGKAELMGLSSISFPENYRVFCLPELEFANNYPTLGPNGKEVMNINGKACSIELFLGQDVLKENEEFIPVHWKGYNDKTQTYQGEVMNKALIQDRYREKMAKIASTGANEYNWFEMTQLLETIFTAFM